MLAAVTLVGAGCKKTYNDTVGGKTADQRITEALAAYQKKLTGSTYGWIFMESTTGVAYNQGVSQTGPAIVLAYYMQFIDSNNVQMISDFDVSMAGTPKTSGYRIKALTRPALIFDTYSYLHVPCDPDVNISHSPFGYGYGWGTDFEFSFSDSEVPTDAGDTIRLLGNLNGASGMLIKATQAQRDAYLQGETKNNLAGLNNINKILNYWKRLTIGGIKYDIRVDTVNRMMTFTWDAAGTFKTQMESYFVTSTGVQLTTPIVNGNQTITSIDNITWDGSFTNFTVTLNGQQGTLAGAATPVKADAAAPARWWNFGKDNGYFWGSFDGFHVNGVDDAFNVKSITTSGSTFVVYSYWAAYSTGTELFIPIMTRNDTLQFNSYGSEPVTPPQFTGGKAIFQKLQDATGVPTPPGGPVDLSNQALYDPAGYYFVQTGDKTYDMVLGTDGKTWISWFWPL